MFANGNPRHDFADTRDFTADPAFANAHFGNLDPLDPISQIESANEADSHLLRLVMCTACATLTLALISSMA
jgi:hypothetical protein